MDYHKFTNEPNNEHGHRPWVFNPYLVYELFLHTIEEGI